MCPVTEHTQSESSASHFSLVIHNTNEISVALAAVLGWSTIGFSELVHESDFIKIGNQCLLGKEGRW